MIARPDLYDLLWSQIPRVRIHLGKRVLSFSQNEQSVMVRSSDNSCHGDIIVGADGAYSAVRQLMYRDLKAVKILPSDMLFCRWVAFYLVGQTVPLGLEELPQLKG